MRGRMPARIIVAPPPTSRDWAEEQYTGTDLAIEWADHEAARLRKLLLEHGWRDWAIEVRIGS